MKKLFVSSLFLASSLVCSAGTKDANVGIGLGTIIFEGHDGLVSQVCAATTNGLFGNQTFAISSGTLGAEKPAELWAKEQMNEFIKGNMDNVAMAIAMGEGESVDTIADILKVEDKEAFKTSLQENFQSIYTNEEVTHVEVVNNIMNLSNS